MNTTTRSPRGNTLPETALVMSLVLLVLFGGIQMALAAFDQLSADGAAFIGAHSAVAQSPTSPNSAYANQVANSVFSHTSTTALSLSNPTGNTTEADFGQTFGTMGFAKFLGSGFATTSRIVEPSQGTSGALNGLPLPIKSTACLENKINASTLTVGKAAIGLPLVSSLTSTDSVTGVIDLTASGLTAQIGARVTLFNSLATVQTSLATDLQSVGSTVNALLTNPLVGTLLNPVLNLTSGTLSTILNSAVQNALAGNTSALSTLGTTISTLLATVNALVAPVELLHPTAGIATLVSNLTTALDSTVTDLTSLGGFENTLNTLDTAASGVVCP